MSYSPPLALKGRPGEAMSSSKKASRPESTSGPKASAIPRPPVPVTRPNNASGAPAAPVIRPATVFAPQGVLLPTPNSASGSQVAPALNPNNAIGLAQATALVSFATIKSEYENIQEVYPYTCFYMFDCLASKSRQ